MPPQLAAPLSLKYTSALFSVAGLAVGLSGPVDTNDRVDSSGYSSFVQTDCDTGQLTFSPPISDSAKPAYFIPAPLSRYFDAYSGEGVTCDLFGSPVYDAPTLTQYIQSHKMRVLRLGQELQRLFPEVYGKVDAELVAAFLSHHDDAKLSGIDPKTKAFVDDAEENLSYELLSLFGIFVDGLSRQDRQQARAVIGRINARDRQVALDFFRERGLVGEHDALSDTAILLLEIERLVDQVDRGMSHQALIELGRMNVKASQYMADVSKKEVLQALEHAYLQVFGS